MPSRFAGEAAGYGGGHSHEGGVDVKFSKLSVCALLVVPALIGVGCSDDDADSVQNEIEAQGDRAQDELDDLQEEVEGELDEAAEELDEGAARAHGEIFRQRLTELGQDDTPSSSVDDLENIAAELPGDPEVTGIEDGDGDGNDDDGKVQITVDGASACVTIETSDVEVTDGAC